MTKCQTPSSSSLPSLEDAFKKLSSTNTPRKSFFPSKMLCYREIISIIIISIKQQIKITRLISNTLLLSLSMQPWLRQHKQLGCSHLLCNWSGVQTTINSEAIMDWKIQDKEMTLKHPSLHLWRLRQLLLLGEVYSVQDGSKWSMQWVSAHRWGFNTFPRLVTFCWATASPAQVCSLKSKIPGP